MTKFPIIDEEIIQGRDWLVYFIVQNPDGSVRTDLGGATVLCDLRRSPTYPSIVVSAHGAVTASVLGEVSLWLTGAETDEIEDEYLVGDPKLILQNGETEFLGRLKVNVIRTGTR